MEEDSGSINKEFINFQTVKHKLEILNDIIKNEKIDEMSYMKPVFDKHLQFNELLKQYDECDVIIGFKKNKGYFLKNPYVGKLLSEMHITDVYMFLSLFLSMHLKTVSKLFNENIFDDIHQTILNLVDKHSLILRDKTDEKNETSNMGYSE